MAGDSTDSKSVHVLAVDDDFGVRFTLKSVLGKHFASVHTCQDGEEAIAVLRGKEFDVLLTDLQMQPMDGYELLAQARTLRPNMPVLVMTADMSPHAVSEAYQRGAKGVIPKPFTDPKDVVDRVTQALESVRERAAISARLQQAGAHLASIKKT